jgi:DNA-binding transcriptional regulator YdaS (Cro superfamily)
MSRQNKLADWFERNPDVTKSDFAERIGVTPSYVSQLIKDSPPLVGLDIAVRIGVATNGEVTPADLAEHWVARRQDRRGRRLGDGARSPGI